VSLLQARRWLILGGAAVGLMAVGFLARPIWHLARTAWLDVDGRAPQREGFLDDASRLDATRVAEIVPVDESHPEKQVAELLARARSQGFRVSIAGARHTMGGHTLYPGAIMIARGEAPLHDPPLRPDRQPVRPLLVCAKRNGRGGIMERASGRPYF
jgi:hypothetical protein